MNKDLVKPYDDDGICPHCSIYKQWSWYYFANMGNNYLGHYTYCNNCKEHTIYYNEKLVYPKNKLLIKPNVLFDTYKKSKKLFLEAVEVSPISPRAGLTLARMCLESLTNEILQEHNEKISENFRDNIEKLHSLDIISLKLKNLLSSARIIGNKSTHNFNIIDTENEPNLEDAMAVLETIDFILENMRIANEKEEKLSQLEEKVRKTKGSKNEK
ncbi:DUF4145 domain-containing protein [Helicobacter sp. T3_23-1056]